VVAIACLAGRGRTGTVVACLLRDGGLGADEAVSLTRETRPYTIERESQVQFVRDWEWPVREALR
jgi:protein-tyrosine phosphatase